MNWAQGLMCVGALGVLVAAVAVWRQRVKDRALFVPRERPSRFTVGRNVKL